MKMRKILQGIARTACILTALYSPGCDGSDRTKDNRKIADAALHKASGSDGVLTTEESAEFLKRMDVKVHLRERETVYFIVVGDRISLRINRDGEVDPSYRVAGDRVREYLNE